MIKKIKLRSLELRKNKNRLSSLYTTLLSEAKTIAKNDNNREIISDDIIKVINKIIKNNKDFISKLTDKNSNKKDELIIEINELMQWLPKKLTKEELSRIIRGIEPTNIGQAMKYLKINFKNQYDGKIASMIIKEYLTNE